MVSDYNFGCDYRHVFGQLARVFQAWKLFGADWIWLQLEESKFRNRFVPVHDAHYGNDSLGFGRKAWAVGYVLGIPLPPNPIDALRASARCDDDAGGFVEGAGTARTTQSTLARPRDRARPVG